MSFLPALCPSPCYPAFSCWQKPLLNQILCARDNLRVADRDDNERNQY